MPDQNIRPELMTLTEKLAALTRMAEQGREGDVYAGIEWLLRMRPQPPYVRAIDEILTNKGDPTNV